MLSYYEKCHLLFPTFSLCVVTDINFHEYKMLNGEVSDFLFSWINPLLRNVVKWYLIFRLSVGPPFIKTPPPPSYYLELESTLLWFFHCWLWTNKVLLRMCSRTCWYIWTSWVRLCIIGANIHYELIILCIYYITYTNTYSDNTFTGLTAQHYLIT